MSMHTILLKRGNIYKYRGFDWNHGRIVHNLLIYLGISDSVESYNDESCNHYTEHNFYDVKAAKVVYVHPALLSKMIENCEIQNA